MKTFLLRGLLLRVSFLMFVLKSRFTVILDRSF